MLALGDVVRHEDTVLLRPICRADFSAVGQFLQTNLNRRLTPARWAEAMEPSWHNVGPNHGFMLLQGDDIVGAQLAFYSEREGRGGVVRLCNVAALCVLPSYRAHSLRLLRALLSQPGFSFTDLSPSGNVRPLNLRLGFQLLDTTTALVVNASALLAPRKVRVIDNDAIIAATLRGREFKVFRDHRQALGAHHLLLTRGASHCHIIYRRDRRKNLPLFATILHVSDPDFFAEGRGQVFRHLLLRHGILFTLMELRLVRARPPLSIMLRGHRPKMFRSVDLNADAIDYLYSELTCVAW
jgi:hypothetical protein